MYENKTRMITNKLINTSGYKAYLSHKLSAIIRDKVSAQIQNNRDLCPIGVSTDSCPAGAP